MNFLNIGFNRIRLKIYRLNILVFGIDYFSKHSTVCYDLQRIKINI